MKCVKDGIAKAAKAFKDALEKTASTALKVLGKVAEIAAAVCVGGFGLLMAGVAHGVATIGLTVSSFGSAGKNSSVANYGVAISCAATRLGADGVSLAKDAAKNAYSAAKSIWSYLGFCKK